MDIKRCKNSFATGRYVYAFALFCWIVIEAIQHFQGKPYVEGVGLIVLSIIALAIQKMAKTYVQLSQLPMSLFILFSILTINQQYFNILQIIPIIIGCSTITLIKEYNSVNQASNLYLCFLLVGISAYIYPWICVLIPIWIIGIATINSITIRGIAASLLGFLTPWWFLLAWNTLSAEKWALSFWEIIAPEIKDVAPTSIPFIVFISLAGFASINFINSFYREKNNTRKQLSFMILAFIISAVMTLVSTEDEQQVWIPLTILHGIFPITHWLTSKYSRMAGIYFVCVVLSLVFMFAIKIWSIFWHY